VRLLDQVDELKHLDELKQLENQLARRKITHHARVIDLTKTDIVQEVGWRTTVGKCVDTVLQRQQPVLQLDQQLDQLDELDQLHVQLHLQKHLLQQDVRTTVCAQVMQKWSRGLVLVAGSRPTVRICVDCVLQQLHVQQLHQLDELDPLQELEPLQELVDPQLHEQQRKLQLEAKNVRRKTTACARVTWDRRVIIVREDG